MVHRATGLAKQFVDFVGRYEDLVDDLVRVLTILDRPFDEVALRAQARENVSRKLHGEPVWHPKLRRQILAPRPTRLSGLVHKRFLRMGTFRRVKVGKLRQLDKSVYLYSRPSQDFRAF